MPPGIGEVARDLRRLLSSRDGAAKLPSVGSDCVEEGGELEAHAEAEAEVGGEACNLSRFGCSATVSIEPSSGSSMQRRCRFLEGGTPRMPQDILDGSEDALFGRGPAFVLPSAPSTVLALTDLGQRGLATDVSSSCWARRVKSMGKARSALSGTCPLATRSKSNRERCRAVVFTSETFCALKTGGADRAGDLPLCFPWSWTWTWMSSPVSLLTDSGKVEVDAEVGGVMFVYADTSESEQDEEEATLVWEDEVEDADGLAPERL